MDGAEIVERVPLSPTKAMVAAGLGAVEGLSVEQVEALWAAMARAAPDAEVVAMASQGERHRAGLYIVEAIRDRRFPSAFDEMVREDVIEALMDHFAEYARIVSRVGLARRP